VLLVKSLKDNNLSTKKVLKIAYLTTCYLSKQIIKKRERKNFNYLIYR